MLWQSQLFLPRMVASSLSSDRQGDDQCLMVIMTCARSRYVHAAETTLCMVCWGARAAVVAEITSVCAGRESRNRKRLLNRASLMA